MSDVVDIIKGIPITFKVGITSDGNPVDLNDGTWTSTAELRYQTEKGPLAPFSITLGSYGLAAQVSLTADQTAQLEHKGTGYILVFRANKTDQSIYIKANIGVNVSDNL